MVLFDADSREWSVSSSVSVSSLQGITMGEDNVADAFRRLFEVHPDGENKGKLTGRLYEYFVNVYSRENGCVYNGIHIHESYLDHCKSYLKKNFTYFRRGESFEIMPLEEERSMYPLKVNVPLMRFLNWIAVHHIDEYILENISDILEHKAYSQGICSTKDTVNIDEITEGLADTTISSNTRHNKPRKVKSDKQSIITLAKKDMSIKRIHKDRKEKKEQIHVARWNHPPPGKLSFEKRLGTIT